MTLGEPAQSLLTEARRLQAAGRLGEAIDAYERLLALRPDLPESWYNLGFLRRHSGRFEAALGAYAEALARGVPDPEEVHLNRAVILVDHLGRADDARGELDAALAANANYVPAWLNLGNLHEDCGNRAGARAAYERVRAIDPDNMLALARLGGIADIAGPDDPVIVLLREALARPHLAAADRADLGFALGRALDAAGAYDEAFDAYAGANLAGRAACGAAFRGYSAEAQEHFVERMIRAFPQSAEPGATRSEPAPIFICGLFRSGSTLAEQLLSRHSRITPGGELGLLPALIHDRLRAYPDAPGPAEIEQLRSTYLTSLRAIHPGADLVTDKRPDNFLHIGLIKAMFPSAKIVHTVRNPLDNLLSIWFLQLDPGMAYAFDLKDLAHWHGQYRRLMAHWKALYPDDIFDLDYDSLVANPRQEIASLLAFCGLGWDEECLDFHRSTNPVRTASNWQVRQPLYRSSSGRWRNYRRHIGDLLDQFS